ncbi:MAG: carbamoyltransferase HypF, partial [Bacteroidota bacterium]
MRKLPYDRATTTMDIFPMCSYCRREYENPLDRRYYSQTNSCYDCGILMQLFEGQNQVIDVSQNKIIAKIVEAWSIGKIVAIKGIGGYLLTCDARNEQAIQQLRDRKHRPSKPFALMFSTLKQIEEVAHLDDLEKATLQSPVSPIVLLNTKQEKVADYLALDAIAPNLNQVGVMLPYTPLFDLLLKKLGQPIIATSGNISNSPIVFNDQKALTELSKIADVVVTNNRPIVVPQDDSVNKFTLFNKQQIILRRSRGLAPTYINADLKWSNQTILATGAMLKSTFSLLQQENTYVSQYLGDLSSFDTQLNYKHTVNHFLKLFSKKPEAVLVDKHPEYSATVFGQDLAREIGCSVHSIQHHVAHFGAVLGENNLLHSKAPVLGVVWDGTGLGDDQQIWGGEFFTYHNYNFSRTTHFDYFDFILGDKMPKEPRISALSVSHRVEGATAILQPKFSPAEWSIYQKLLAKNNRLKTSSVGRIFDAVVSLLGMMDRQTYAGEAAMQLEKVATSYFVQHGLAFEGHYFSDANSFKSIPTKSLFAKIVADIQSGKTKAFIAAKFHYSLAQLVK